MILKRYLSSLKSTYYFMIAFGLGIGAIFPFYSYLFFGRKAFSPLYAIGCITAGFLVGTFCYYIIKQVMHSYLESQWETLRKFVGGTELELGGDELQILFDSYDRLIHSVLVMVQNISAQIVDIVPLYHELSSASRDLRSGNERQVEEVYRSRDAVEGMHASFRKVLSETEDLSSRSEQRASLAAEMSGATEAMAESIREYSSAVEETTASIGEIAATIRQTSSNIEALSSSTEQTTSSIFQISSAVAEIRDSALRSSACSENVRVKAVEGITAVEATRNAMIEIERANDESSRCIERLASSSARVGDIIGVIQEVVQQTNLLSLNAFIIAAQAGEHGAGFAVVAREVKALATRTADSATEIDELVKDIQRETGMVQHSVREGSLRVRDGVRIAEKADYALVKIGESAAEASEMVRKIALATEEQSTGALQISGEVEKNLTRVKEIRSTIVEQERRTSSMVRTLEQMKVLSHKITLSAQEQARGNKLYLKSVLDDSDKARNLKAEFMHQLKAAEEVRGFMREAGVLIEGNAEEASRIADRIEAVAELTERLKREVAHLVGR